MVRQDVVIVEKCLECDRYNIEIENLQQGLRLAKDDARAAQDKRPKGQMDQHFELMLRLAYRLDETRQKFSRHRTTHVVVN